MAEVFTPSELTDLADELFNLEELVEKARLEPVEHTEQLALDVQPMVRQDDAAYKSMMDALRVSEQFKRKRGQRGGTALHNQLREDLQKAWVVLGGWRFVVACVASKDETLRTWALRLFEKAVSNTGVLAAVRAPVSPGSGNDEEYQAFYMALNADPVAAEQFMQSIAEARVDRFAGGGDV